MALATGGCRTTSTPAWGSRRRSTPRGRPCRLAAVASADGEAPFKAEVSLADVKKGKRLGGGAFGEVFEGTLKQSKRVVLKGRKGKDTRFAEQLFKTEAVLARRASGVRSAPTFVGVAGAGVWLVWDYDGEHTLEESLSARDPLKEAGKRLGGKAAGGGQAALKRIGRLLLEAADDFHAAGLVHRDIKPSNVLVCEKSKRLVLIDVGACADLREGTNFDAETLVFDPLYGPPEKELLGVTGPLGRFLGGGLGWQQKKPDLFDSFTCGMTLLRFALPSCRTKGGLQKIRTALQRSGYDLEAVRETLGSRADADFELLDADGGKGLDLVAKLLAPRAGWEGYGGPERLSVKKALGHPFLR